MHHILFIGAHPDDCDFSGGGTAALMARRGDRVLFVSMTNGDKGHFAPEYLAEPGLLAARRLEEGRRAAQAIGVKFVSMGVHDGEVYVSQLHTEQLLRRIRTWGPPGSGPDMVLLNRPNDYHRDHRYTAQMVLDTTYMLTVPMLCPDTPHLTRMPVFAYWSDRFQEGGPFRADVIVPIDDAMEAKTAMGAEHASQFFEWLPYNAGRLASIPQDASGRQAYLRSQTEARAAGVRARCAPEDAPYRFAEAFQISEYGRQPSAEELAALFPAGVLAPGGKWSSESLL